MPHESLPYLNLTIHNQNSEKQLFTQSTPSKTHFKFYPSLFKQPPTFQAPENNQVHLKIYHLKVAHNTVPLPFTRQIIKRETSSYFQSSSSSKLQAPLVLVPPTPLRKEKEEKRKKQKNHQNLRGNRCTVSTCHLHNDIHQGGRDAEYNTNPKFLIYNYIEINVENALPTSFGCLVL